MVATGGEIHRDLTVVSVQHAAHAQTPLVQHDTTSNITQGRQEAPRQEICARMLGAPLAWRSGGERFFASAQSAGGLLVTDVHPVPKFLMQRQPPRHDGSHMSAPDAPEPTRAVAARWT